MITQSKNSVYVTKQSFKYFYKLFEEQLFLSNRINFLQMLTESNQNHTKSPLNQLFATPTVEEDLELQNDKFIIESQFSIHSQQVRLQLYSKFLKLTFLTTDPTNLPQYSSLRLDHTVKASEIVKKNEILFPMQTDSIIKKIGFSISKTPSLCLNFESQDENLIEIWMNHLSKLIFLTGFSNSFKATKYIGRGEFGQVWEVERIKDGRRFAAKIIDKDVCFGQVNGRQAVYNEIQILKKIKHPNIVQLECIFQSQKNFYIVQQLIQGKNLSQFIKKGKDLSETLSSDKFDKQRNIKIMKSLLKAVDYLHKSGIAHRDLKPGNIIINNEDHMPYLIDFGLSQFTDKKDYLFDCCGSPGYIAPQLLSNQPEVDLKKSDIFSLGAIFYMLLTQEPLFSANEVEDILEQNKNCRKIVTKKVKSSFSGSEAKLLLSLLDQDPQKRITAEDALSHDYFVDAMYYTLQEIRQPLIQMDEKHSKRSLNVEHFKNRFEELFSESSICVENKLKLVDFVKQQEHNNSINLSRNLVTLSSQFLEKTRRRVNRYMSEEEIDVDIAADKKQKSTWSGKWKKIKNLQQLFFGSNFWPIN